jgi:hypothetical protein
MSGSSLASLDAAEGQVAPVSILATASTTFYWSYYDRFSYLNNSRNSNGIEKEFTPRLIAEFAMFATVSGLCFAYNFSVYLLVGYVLSVVVLLVPSFSGSHHDLPCSAEEGSNHHFILQCAVDGFVSMCAVVTEAKYCLFYQLVIFVPWIVLYAFTWTMGKVMDAWQWVWAPYRARSILTSANAVVV